MVNLDFFKEISIGQSELIKSVAVFYLIIFTNTVLGLFTCEQINLIKKNYILGVKVLNFNYSFFF